MGSYQNEIYFQRMVHILPGAKTQLLKSQAELLNQNQ